MRLDDRRRRHASAWVGGLLLLGGAVSLADSPAPRILDLSVEDGVLTAAVFHPGSGTVSGRVVFEVETAGRRAFHEVPFRAFGGQKVFVHFVAPSVPDRVIQAGIIVDDGAPI